MIITHEYLRGIIETCGSFLIKPHNISLLNNLFNNSFPKI